MFLFTVPRLFLNRLFRTVISGRPGSGKPFPIVGSFRSGSTNMGQLPLLDRTGAILPMRGFSFLMSGISPAVLFIPVLPGEPGVVMFVVAMKSILPFKASVILQHLAVEKVHRTEAVSDGAAGDIFDPGVPVVFGPV